MIKRLDRYIIRSFLTSALLWFIIFMSLRVVVDLFINMDEFTEGDKGVAQLLKDIWVFYSYQPLVYVIEMGGLIIVASAAFSLARMNHTNELTAMLASGVSLYRVIWPVILCAMLLGGVVIVDQELLVPRVADKLVRARDDVRGLKIFSVPLITDGSNTAWHAASFQPAKGQHRLIRPIILVRDEEFQLIAPIFGRSARPAAVEGVRGWIIEQAVFAQIHQSGRPWPHIPDTERVFSTVGPGEILRRAGGSPEAADVSSVESVDAADETYGLRIVADRFIPDPFVPGAERGGKLIDPKFAFKTHGGRTLGIFVAPSADWVVPGAEFGGYWKLTEGELFYPSDLTPQDIILRRSSGWLDFMSASQLTSLLRLRRLPDPQSVQMTRHIRYTDPINNLIMLLLGLPFIVSRERNIKTSAGLCLLVVASFYAFIYLCRYIGLAPALSAWMPILIFGGVAAVMLDSIKT
ncbi:MAG: LptF/LptG family permease [Phycisphaerae bacterium]|nr:LptF/LptG family permease [Phycisphaerae bacterium]